MTLKEKFKLPIGAYDKINDYVAKQCEEIADYYAIEFAEWCRTIISRTGLLEYKLKWMNKTTKELLEIFKKEKGL